MSTLRAAYGTFNDDEYDDICREAFGRYYLKSEPLGHIAQMMGVPECDVMELADCVALQLQAKADAEEGSAAPSVLAQVKTLRLESLERAHAALGHEYRKLKVWGWCVAITCSLCLGWDLLK